jgi:homopolymeric O-antigen transport system ATP-binding protein
MSDIAIRAEGLSKQYRIGELKKYKAIRDTLTEAIYYPFRRLQSVFSDERTRDNEEERTIRALKDVSFEIKQGEVAGIIGRNGAGKSTLLKILSRITEPTEGFVDLHGRVGSLIEVGTGFHPELTGRENIYLNGSIIGMTKREIDRKFDEIVDFAEIEQFLDTPVKYYSSGMYMRLAFSVAAHLEPEILLVDEVLNVGDAGFQKKCLGKMGNVARAGRTVVFVSHNMAVVQNLCSVAHLLSDGQLVASGSVNSVIAHYIQKVADSNVQRLSSRVDRQGDGRLRITEFQAVGNGVSAAPMCGDEAQFKITYRGSDPLRNIHISMGFYNLYGEGALYLSNDLVSRSFEVIPANGTFTCQFDRLPILPGLYSINLYCTVNGILADWVTDAARVNIEDGDFYGSGKLPPKGYGSIAVPHDWFVQ